MKLPRGRDLRPEARAQLEALLAKTWSLPGEHPLARLDGLFLGETRVIVLLGPKNNVGSRYFQLWLADTEGHLSSEALALGLYNSGPFPAFNWVEFTRYQPRASFNRRQVDIRDGGHDLALFEALSALVPVGGHIMCEYDSPSQKATERILTLGYPPAVSPLGYRLFQAGCRSYRDWYISEGGREGPRKLQGFKPLNEEIASEKTAKLRAEVEGLLSCDNSTNGEWGAIARRNAEAILGAL